MKIEELKKFATTENLNNKPDVTKLAVIFSLLLQGILVKVLYGFAIVHTLIFVLYLYLGVGWDWNTIKIICSYLVLVIFIKFSCPRVFDKYIV